VHTFVRAGRFLLIEQWKHVGEYGIGPRELQHITTPTIPSPITFSPADDGQQHPQGFAINGSSGHKEAYLHASWSSSRSEAEVPPVDRFEMVPLAGLVVVFCFVSCAGVSIRSVRGDTKKDYGGIDSRAHDRQRTNDRES